MNHDRVRRLRLLIWLIPVTLLAACVPKVPTIDGTRAAPRSPNEVWQPPAGTIPGDSLSRSTTSALPASLVNRIQTLTLADLIDLALRNNPTTRLSWAQAEAAAAAYGSARGRFLPALDAATSLGRTRVPSASGPLGLARTQYGPTLTLSYLLLDFGARTGTIQAAREATIALDLTHNATIEDVVLQVETAYFNFMAARDLVAAQRQTVREAEANLEAAQQRHDVGVATIADVLQARTALSQADLALETSEGNIQTARGALATAVGLPANLPYDLEAPTDSLRIGRLADSVDTIVERAVRNRPDLASARAQTLEAEAQVREARALQFPSLALSATAGHIYSDIPAFQGPSYGLTVGLQLPLFNGLSRQYDVVAAQAQADAAGARADQVRTQVINQVFTSYYALQTATQRLHTADDLLASAQQSEQVASGRYHEGIGSIIDLLTAQTALANARAEQSQTRWVWYTALAQLAHDAGVLGVHGEAPLHLTADSTTRHR